MRKYNFNSLSELNNIKNITILSSNVVYDAIKLIIDHLNKKSKILIINDFDTDGISALFIFYNYLKTLFPNSNIHYYTLKPSENRKIDYKDEFKKYDLIITLDCGVNSTKFEFETIANKQDLIVIDHHIIETPVKALKIHPEFLSLTYNIAGSGLAIKFVEAFSYLLPIDKNKISEFINYLYIYAGIGTITDIVGVLNINRQILLNGYYNAIKHETFLNKIFNSKTTMLLYYSTYGSLLNSLLKIQSSINLEIDLMKLYNGDENEIKKALYLYNKKKELINEAYSNLKNIVIKETPLYYMIKLNADNEGIMGALLNRILHNTSKKYVIGIVKKENDKYKISIRSKEKLALIFMIKDLFIDSGGHDYAYSGFISEANLHKFFKKLDMVFIDIKTKKDEETVNLDEIYDSEMKKDIIKMIPFGIDFMLPNIKITKDISKYANIIIDNTSDKIDIDKKIYKISLLKTISRKNNYVVIEKILWMR